jgi:hypothetical protein
MRALFNHFRSNLLVQAFYQIIVPGTGQICPDWQFGSELELYFTTTAFPPDRVTSLISTILIARPFEIKYHFKLLFYEDKIKYPRWNFH